MTTADVLEPHWRPDQTLIAQSNLGQVMTANGFADYGEFHQWSVNDRAGFWRLAIDRLSIAFESPPETILGPGEDAETPAWLPGARLNIVVSCFQGNADATAIVASGADGIRRVSVGELRRAVAQFANGLAEAGFVPGERVAIAMPMTVEAVVAYLGIVAAGCAVVSIADSFAPEEIATRLALTDAQTVVTQDHMIRGGKTLPMYDKVVAAGAARCIVVDTGAGATLRDGDQWWAPFLSSDDALRTAIGPPERHTNVLFSSGTTGDPKVIPWTQLTPIKAAVDGHFHQDIRAGDVVAWPTNLGWMMGPWLIYASLLNRAAIALYHDAPVGREFGEFVRDAEVTMLGLVPSLVSIWRESRCMEGLDWTALRTLSSTGEASNASDMAYLMDLAGKKPVIEYCGGTEIGGGYITGTVVQPAVPGCFTTPALGLDLVVLDDAGQPARTGEVFIVPPSIGLSTELLNRDHHEVYFAGVPEWETPLRRHGDQMEALDGRYYRAHGRVDDTMNLGGIKVSSAEIERALLGIEGIVETAVVAVPPPGGGPERLVIFAVPQDQSSVDAAGVTPAMQQAIRVHLNPLFKIHDVVLVDALPRTASAKVMRRSLRSDYTAE